jgi:hypothetical protein
MTCPDHNHPVCPSPHTHGWVRQKSLREYEEPRVGR